MLSAPKVDAGLLKPFILQFDKRVTEKEGRLQGLLLSRKWTPSQTPHITKSKMDVLEDALETENTSMMSFRARHHESKN